MVHNIWVIRPVIGSGPEIMGFIFVKTSVLSKSYFMRVLEMFAQCPRVEILFWSLSFHSRMFHSYGDVTIADEGLQVLTLTYARLSWPLSSEDSLACHTYCYTGHPFIMVIFKDPCHSPLLPSVYLFLRLRSVATGARTRSLACEANDLYQLNNHSDVFVCYFGVCTFFSSSLARTILPMSSKLTTEAYSIFSYGKNHTLFSKEYTNTILTKHWIFLKNYYPVSVKLIGTRFPFVKRILLCSSEG